MFLKKAPKKRSQEEIEIDRVLKAYQEKIDLLKKNSQGIKETALRQSNTLPPMDTLATRKQHKRLKVAMTRGSTENLKREVKTNALLLLLLIFAIATSSALAIKLLQQL